MQLEDEIIHLREAVARIETRLESMNMCPAPGACMALEARVRILEASEDRRKGAWAWLLGLLTVAGALGGIIALVVTKK